MNENAIDVSRIRPVGNKLLVRKCCRGDEGLIITPDAYKDHSEFVEILAVGAKCLHFTEQHIGMFVQCPEMSDAMHHLGEDHWFVGEHIIEPVVFE